MLLSFPSGFIDTVSASEAPSEPKRVCSGRADSRGAMDRDKLAKMASAVRTGGKGTVRRCVMSAVRGCATGGDLCCANARDGGGMQLYTLNAA